MLNLRGQYDDGFWNGALLRMSHRHRFLEHFVVALSSLDEAYRIRTNLEQSDVALTRYCFSLGQYQKALEGFRLNVTKGDSLELVLASCLICVCIELWHGDHAAAGYHALTGAHLAWSNQGSESQRDSSILPMLRAMLVRLCGQLGVEAGKMPATAQMGEMSPWPAIVLNPGEGVTHAHAQFYEMLEGYVASVDSMPAGSREGEASVMQEKLDKWYRLLEAETEEKTGREYHLLVVHYHAVSASLEALATGDETRYDSHTNHFEELIEHCRPFISSNAVSHGSIIQSWRTLDGSIVMALLLLIMKCRDARLRRIGLRMLYRSRRLEGVFHSSMMGAIAEQILALEEDRSSVLGDVQYGVPSTLRRVRVVSFNYNPGIIATLPQSEGLQKWSLDPPSMCYTYFYTDTPDVHETVRFRLKPYFSIGGFGLKSCFWYPMSKYPTIMDEEIPLDTRHLEGPHLGLTYFSGSVNFEARDLLYFRLLTIHLPLESNEQKLVLLNGVGT